MKQVRENQTQTNIGLAKLFQADIYTLTKTPDEQYHAVHLPNYSFDERLER